MGESEIPRPLNWRRGAFEFSGKWKEAVRALRESGMGYTIVRVVLTDGRRFDQVLIAAGVVHRVRRLPDIPFTEDDIAEITATHERWDWKETP